MRIGTWVVGALAVAALALKLFTYEYYLTDDPSSGLALRSSAGFVNHQPLQKTDRVLVSDENGFVGESVYRAVVNWGWAVIGIAWPVVFWYEKSRTAASRGKAPGS